MKKMLLPTSCKLSFLALFALVIFIQSCCNNSSVEKKCCEGYTGSVIKDSKADSLRNRCHFMIKDSIVSWAARYKANKNLIFTDSLPGYGKILGDSCSFNRCIIKAIICNDNCIGLRVIYGMDPVHKKVHIILVGINPDYSTLYIPRPKECCGNNATAKNQGDNTLSGKGSELGGAEYSQMP